jgi:hypothetical protein
MLQVPDLAILECLAAAGSSSAGRAACIANVHDRAAVALQVWQRAKFAVDRVPCSVCAKVTSSYCEACLWRGRRYGQKNCTPFAVCTECSREQRTCSLCEAEHITHTEAQALCRETFLAASQGRAVLLFGTWRENGVFERFEEPVEFPTHIEEQANWPSSSTGAARGRAPALTSQLPPRESSALAMPATAPFLLLTDATDKLSSASSSGRDSQINLALNNQMQRQDKF